MTLSIAAGIDAGHRFLDVGLAPSGQTFRVPNTPQGIALILARLTRDGITRVVLEAVGHFAQALVQALAAAGFEVGLVNPRRIKAFRDAEGRRAKTDRLDAQLIARFALVMKDAVRPLPDAKGLALKALSTRRRQLVEMIAMEKVRLKQAHDALVLQSLRRTIADLQEQQRAIEDELAQRITADPRLAETFALLTSIPGIGARIATLVVTDLPELGQRDRKVIASLVGLAPHVTQSGTAPARAAISGGRPCLRAAFYMAALVAVRHDPAMKAAYTELKRQGKPAKVALIAVARRIVVIANALVKERRPYQNHAPAS